jgi:hypothetical protein
VAILEIVRIEEFIPSSRGFHVHTPKDLIVIVRAFWLVKVNQKKFELKVRSKWLH